MSPAAGMASPFATFVQCDWVLRRATAWIEAQRAEHRPHAGRISDTEHGRLAPYFEAATLEPVRVRPIARLEPPAGFRLLGRLPPFALDFDRVLAITFGDTIVVAEDLVPEAARLENLFHECVHVAQYQLLGVAEFVRRYLAGWAAAGYRYEAIPLERHAYALAERFARGEPFAVETELVNQAQYG